MPVAPILLNMIRDLWGRVGPYLKLLMQADRYIPQSNDAHRKIARRTGATQRSHRADFHRRGYRRGGRRAVGKPWHGEVTA